MIPRECQRLAEVEPMEIRERATIPLRNAAASLTLAWAGAYGMPYRRLYLERHQRTEEPVPAHR